MKKRDFIIIPIILFILPIASSTDSNSLLCCIDKEGRCYTNRDSCDNFESYSDNEDCKIPQCGFGCCKANSCFLGFKQECNNLQGQFFNDITDINECKNKCEVKQEYKKFICQDVYYTNYEPLTCPPCNEGYVRTCEKTANQTISNTTVWLERAKCTKNYKTECSLNPKCEKGSTKIDAVNCEKEISKGEYKKLKCRDSFFTDWRTYSCINCSKGYSRKCEEGYVVRIWKYKLFWMERAECKKEYFTDCSLSPSCKTDVQVSSQKCESK